MNDMLKPVICPECHNLGHKSTITLLGSSKTCLGWVQTFDENGFPTGKDPNVTNSSYKCSNGHVWKIKSNAK